MGKTRGKIFESGTTGEAKGSEKEGLRNSALDCKVLGMKEKQWEKAKALYLAGKSWKAISDETGLNQSTLMSKASRDEWTTFRKGMRDTISSKEIQSLETLSTLVRSKLAADAASTLERIEGYALDGIKDVHAWCQEEVDFLMRYEYSPVVVFLNLLYMKNFYL